MSIELKNEIEGAKVISVLTHVYPDPDAVCSGLLTYHFIKDNFTGKKVVFNIEGDIAKQYSFLTGFNEISNKNTVEHLAEHDPNLIIVVDTNNYRNLSSGDDGAIKQYVKSKDIQTVVIDNHPQVFKDIGGLYINSGASSSSEEVYKIFTRDFDLKPFPGAYDMTMYGIMADTNRFLYTKENYRDTFSVVTELLDGGAVIEELWNRLYVLKKSHTVVMAELLRNVDSKDDYNYSYITDDFAKDFVNKGGDWDTFSDAFYLFVDQYIRYIGDNIWGFAIIPDFSNDKGEYRGAFRALNDRVDTSLIAKELGGGGHKSASGFSVKAGSYEEALGAVESAIKKTRS